MPKDILPIRLFEGGLNNSTNPRDIQDNELHTAINVDTNRVGAIKSMGSFESFFSPATSTALDGVVANDGFGIAYMQIDTKMSNNEGDVTNGHYIAIHKPAGSNPKIMFYQDPVENSGTQVYLPTTFQLPNVDTSNSKIDYLYVDGGIRVFDTDVQNTNLKPQKIMYIPKDRHYFKGASNNDLDITASEWICSQQFIKAPNGGTVQLSEGINQGDVESPPSGDLTVDLVVMMDAGQGSIESNSIGWGANSTDANNMEFYASFVYDNDQESMATALGSINMGGGTTSNGATFLPYVKTGSDAGSWDKRIIGVNIYYRNNDFSKDIIYLVGKFDVVTYGSENIAEQCGITTDGSNTNSNQYALLLGDKTGKTTNLTFVTANDAGVFHKTPPTIFTHAVSSGINSTAVSTECYYKTAALVNRKLYVGNIKQKTLESPTTEKHYPDRLLKSITNRFDVLPDNNFIDVNIKDGENIVKLVGMGNRLYMFKESTLYVIAVAGGEEYLEGTYPHLGIKHPHAVVKTDVGLFWVNKHGAYITVEEKPPSSLTRSKIKDSYWSSFITDNSICGYDPRNKQYIIIKDASNITGTGDTTVNDLIVWNLQTNSWNLGYNKIGASSNPKCTNLINYTDANGDPHLLTFIHSGDLVEWKTADELTTLGTNVFEVSTKELTGNAPNLRKKFYSLYITYKLENISVKPTVKLKLNGKDYDGEITLEADTDFVATTTDFKTALFKVASADKDKVKNVYGAQVVISGSGLHESFEINDMSLIIRMKSVK